MAKCCWVLGTCFSTFFSFEDFLFSFNFYWFFTFYFDKELVVCLTLVKFFFSIEEFLFSLSSLASWVLGFSFTVELIFFSALDLFFSWLLSLDSFGFEFWQAILFFLFSAELRYFSGIGSNIFFRILSFFSYSLIGFTLMDLLEEQFEKRSSASSTSSFAQFNSFPSFLFFNSLNASC